MATVAAVARGAGARAAAGLRGGSGAAARGRPRASCARRLCTAPAAVDMKRYLWERYHEAKRSTDGECAPQPAPPPGDARSPHPTSAARLPPAEKASPKLPNSCFPCPCPGKLFSHREMVEPGVCIGSALGRRKVQGRQSEDVTPNTVRCCHSP